MARVLHVLALVAMLMFTACVGPGERVIIPLTMPDGERATIVAHDQSFPDWMLDQRKLAINYIVKGDVSRKQLAAVAATEKACRLYTGTVRPNNLVAVLSSGVLYAAAGALGGGLGSMAITGAIASEYAQYSASALGTAGLANGIITLGGQTYTFENCGREVLYLFPSYKVRVLQKSPY
mgnify:FL=1